MTTPSQSVSIIAPAIYVSKAIAKKAYTKFMQWSRMLIRSPLPSGITQDIRLTVINGGERFIKFAKNPTNINKGLTARAGTNVKNVVCNKQLTRLEKFKVLNSMKTKKYIHSSGGITSYKAMSSIERKSQRKQATNFMNTLIQNSGCSSQPLQVNA